MLRDFGEILERCPGRSDIGLLAHKLGIPNNQIKASKSYEGTHLAREGDAFEGVYIALNKGVLVRYSLLEEPDFYWLRPRDPRLAQKKEEVTAPWETKGKLTSLAYLASHTRIFDMTHECQMTGTTELLTASPQWVTGVFQGRGTHTLFLRKGFLSVLSETSRTVFFENAARVSITTWAIRCREKQELLACAAAGEANPAQRDQNGNTQDRHGDRSLFFRQMALDCLQRMAKKRALIRASDNGDAMNLGGNSERLAYYVGVRPQGFKGTWGHLSGRVRGERAEPLPKIIEKVELGEKRTVYVLHTKRLKEALGDSKFSLDLKKTLKLPD